MNARLTLIVVFFTIFTLRAQKVKWETIHLDESVSVSFPEKFQKEMTEEVPEYTSALKHCALTMTYHSTIDTHLDIPDSAVQQSLMDSVVHQLAKQTGKDAWVMSSDPLIHRGLQGRLFSFEAMQTSGQRIQCQGFIFYKIYRIYIFYARFPPANEADCFADRMKFFDSIYLK